MRQTVEICLSGPDRPGLTGDLLRPFAQEGVRILDLVQQATPAGLLLSVLAECADEAHCNGLTEALQALAEPASLRLDARRVAGDCLAARADEAQHVLTVMAPALTGTALARAGQLVADAGLRVERIQRLSRLEAGDGSPECFELSLGGAVGDAEGLRQRLLETADALGVDLALQRDTPFRRHRQLAVFDMDSTLIQAEVIDELARVAGVGEEVAAITERAMRGELDFRASFRERLALLEGLPETALAEVGASLRLTEGAERLFAQLHHLGYRTAILSGGFTYFARQLQARLGIDHVFANELQIVDGKLTGVAVEPIVDAQRKADLLEQLAAEHGFSLEQTIAVGDGANDLPMLARAGLGVAFRAKPLVRRSARQAISACGLDGVLYLLGVRDQEHPASAHSSPEEKS